MLTTDVLYSAAALGATSLFGSIIALTVKSMPHRLGDIFLGFCAGMMLGASIVCLILPAVDATAPARWWTIAVGVALGVALIGFLDYVVPHLHRLTGLELEDHHSTMRVDRVLLFVIAIAIHKLPEGMATGIVYNGDVSQANVVSFVIALQNIPEGMVAITPLLMLGMKWTRALVLALVIAVIEVVGVLSGYFIGDLLSGVLPILLSAAGGAMLYVISDEMIPETHSHGYQKQATYALICGLLLMIFIQKMS